MFPEWLIPGCCMAAQLSHMRRNHTNVFVFFFPITSGLWTLEKCLRHFPTEPKHFLPLRRLMVWMCASSACMSRNMVLSAHSPTLGRLHLNIVCNMLPLRFDLVILIILSFLLSTCADGSTYHTLTVFTSLDLAFYGLQYTMRSSLDTWNMSRNLGMSASSLLYSRSADNMHHFKYLMCSFRISGVVCLLAGIPRATSGHVHLVKEMTTSFTAILPNRRSQSQRDCRSGTGRCWTRLLLREFYTTIR